MKIAVIGAGVIGLSTALQISELVPSADVTLLADSFTPHVTSNAAAGHWHLHMVGNTPVHLLLRWSKATIKHLLCIINSAEAAVAGVQIQTGYRVFSRPEGTWNPLCKDLFLDFHPMTARELELYRGYQRGWVFTTVLAECDKYLPYLTTRLKKNGVSMIQTKVKALEELLGHYDIVVNCCGAWAGLLVKDPDLRPTRGQAVKVKAPWLKHSVLSNIGGFYILPGIETVTLGGTQQVGRWDMEADPEDRRRIWEGCTRLVPSLKAAEFVKDVVGLRPQRSSVRLEQEVVVKDGKAVLVVHNYGHGGAGVSLHWGCARDAAHMVKDWLLRHSKSKL